MAATVEILAIGDELLKGLVQETNGHWLAKRIAARGAGLRRVTMLPDDPPVVAAEIRAALARAPALIVTHGGLGPTDDDRTREALGLALELPLEPHAAADEIVRRRYTELAADGIVADPAIDEPRGRMARLPRGARATDNRVGTAPGIVLAAGRTTIVSLPGVPPELAWIWEHELPPLLDEVLGPGGFHEVTIELAHRDESSIALVLREVQARHPDVYVKSRAHGFGAGEDGDVRVTLAAAGRDDAEARARVRVALEELRAALRAVGVLERGLTS